MSKSNGHELNATEQFIIAWQQSDSPDEAAEICGIQYASAVQMASQLRRNGVPLKRYRAEKRDYKALAKLAKDALK